MNLKNRQQLLIALTVAVVGILALDKLVVSPYVDAWKARNVRIANLEESLRRGRALLERTNSLQKQWEEYQHQSLPADESVAENQVLQAVLRWTRSSRLDFNSLNPQWRDHEAGYRTFEIRANAVAALPAVTRFLYEVQTDPLAVQLEECELTAHDEKGEQVNMRVRLSGLQLPKKEPKTETRSGARTGARTEPKKK
jgi:hypothetical protein